MQQNKNELRARPDGQYLMQSESFIWLHISAWFHSRAELSGNETAKQTAGCKTAESMTLYNLQSFIFYTSYKGKNQKPASDTRKPESRLLMSPTLDGEIGTRSLINKESCWVKVQNLFSRARGLQHVIRLHQNIQIQTPRNLKAIRLESEFILELFLSQHLPPVFQGLDWVEKTAGNLSVLGVRVFSSWQSEQSKHI